MSNNIIWNPSRIEIRPQSLVMCCGIANSGKSTLAKKLFPEKNIINTDEVLENTIKELLNITKRDIDITPESKEWKYISNHLANVAILKNQEFINDLIINASQTEDIVILDSAPHNYKDRIATIINFFPYFENIYLIVAFPDIKEVASHKTKSISTNQIALGFYYPDICSLSIDFANLDTQIVLENIADEVTKTFIITDLNSDIEVLI